MTACAESRGNADHGTAVGWPGSDEKATTSRSSGMTSWCSNGANAGANGMVPFGWSPRFASQTRFVAGFGTRNENPRVGSSILSLATI